MKGFIPNGMISSMIDILMSFQSKDDLFENFFTIGKISFASVLLINIELQLEFGSVSKKIHFVRFSVLLNVDQCWEKNALDPTVISSSLYSLLLSINISCNLLMCDCFLQIIFSSTFHISTLSIYVYL